MYQRPKPRIYNERDAELYGRRRLCYAEGHDLKASTSCGGVQGLTEAEARKAGVMVAVCDQITCRRCDAVFTVTYPEIGQEA